MRDLLFKNLTSDDKKRKIVATSEIMDKQGVRSIIHRHFVCLLKEVEGDNIARPLPKVYVLKEHNTKEHKEKFYCRLKGSLYAVNKGKLFIILFMHSLKINLLAIAQDSIKHNEEGCN